MSTASPLPLEPLPPALQHSAAARDLKQEVASRLAQHRQRRPLAAAETLSAPSPVRPPAAGRRRVADSVAARFAESTTYRDFLQAEAAAAVHKAEAAAEIARRNAAAVVAAQQQLLSEISRWNGMDAAPEESQAPPQDAIHPLSPAGVPSAISQPVEAPAPAEHPWWAVDATAAAVVEPLEPAVAIPANLIEFPRQLIAARKARPRLAEGPLRDDADAAPERAQLRIFEVEPAALSADPATTSVLPEWHTIRLEAQETFRAAERPGTPNALAVPIYTAAVSLRVMAGTVDACCILGTFLAAVVVASYASPALPGGIYAAVAAAGTLVLFSLMYFLLFFSLSGTTHGMRYARIGLCTFSDSNPTRASMCRRLFAVLLASLPLGLGLVWACMDEDGLGWHDRISRMYPREY